jgi:hypothetical protein
LGKVDLLVNVCLQIAFTVSPALTLMTNGEAVVGLGPPLKSVVSGCIQISKGLRHCILACHIVSSNIVDRLSVTLVKARSSN